MRLTTGNELVGSTLKGDSSKLRSHTGWNPKYTFESMMDEMIDYWLNFYKL